MTATSRGLWVIVGAALAVALGLGSARVTAQGVGAPGLAPPAVARGVAPAAEWRRNEYCGVNCLYVTLKMLGARVSYERLAARAAVSPMGSTMAEMSRLARDHGVRLTPVRGDRSGVASWPLPAIVHQRRGLSQVGYYVILLARGGGSFTTLDCTTGEIRVLTEKDFFGQWSGYVLLRSGAPATAPQGWRTYAWLIVCLWSFAFGLWRWLRGHLGAAAAPDRPPHRLVTGAPWCAADVGSSDDPAGGVGGRDDAGRRPPPAVPVSGRSGGFRP